MPPIFSKPGQPTGDLSLSGPQFPYDHGAVHPFDPLSRAPGHGNDQSALGSSRVIELAEIFRLAAMQMRGIMASMQENTPTTLPGPGVMNPLSKRNTMKVIRFLSAIAGLLSVFTLSSCADSVYSPQYYSPLQNAEYVSTGATIVVRYGPVRSISLWRPIIGPRRRLDPTS
jgi:hypothetical protein